MKEKELEKKYNYYSSQAQFWVTTLIGTAGLYWALSAQGKGTFIAALPVFISVLAGTYFWIKFVIYSRTYVFK